MSFRYSPLRKSMRERSVGQSDIPLSVCIQNTLERYPDGSLLKELLQNAEDAKATELRLTIDTRQFRKERLFEPLIETDNGEDLSVCQGPALVVWNDATFAKADWDSIQHPERSYKADEPDKIGRFGSGFIAVYHVTDFPWILSGNRLMVLDPRKTGIFGEDTRECKRGYDWILDDPEELEEINAFSDQFAPFELTKSGRSATGGTTFRLPLRKKKSILSPKVYTALRNPSHEEGRSLEELFTAFVNDGPYLLLFLSSVKCISLWKRLPRSTAPELIYKTTARREGPILRIDVLTPTERYSRGWIVERHESQMAEITYMGNILRTTPKVAVAAQFPLDDDISKGGFTFCFLPLPQDEVNFTGFPVHIHGYFALNDNRRSILWPSTDNQKDTRVKWNQVLLSKVLPVAYLNMMKTLKSFIDGLQPENFDKAAIRLGELWPHPALLKRQWKSFLPMFYRLAQTEELFWSDFSGKWVCFQNAVFSRAPFEIDKYLAVQKICKIKGLNIVTGVDPLVPTFFTPFIPDVVVNYMSPAFLSKTLRNSPWILENGSELTTPQKLELLEYFLLDPEGEALSGLRLLPLADGSFAEFSSSSTHSTVFVAGPEMPMDLFPGAEKRFLLPKLANQLEKIVGTGKFQLRKVTIEDFPMLLKIVLDTHNVKRDYLERVWTFLGKHFPNLDPFHYIKLLPKEDDIFASPTKHVQLTEINPTKRYLSAKGLPISTVWWLQKNLNLTIVSWWNFLTHPALEQYVLDPERPESIMKALSDTWKTFGKKIESITFDESEEKFPWLLERLSKISPSLLSEEEYRCMKKLPIFHSIRGGPLISAEQGRLKCLPRVCTNEVKDLLLEVGYPHPLIQLDYSDVIMVSLATTTEVQEWPLNEVVGHLIHMVNQDWNAHRKVVIHWLLLNQEKYDLDLSSLNAAYVGSELIELAQFSDAHPISGIDIRLVEAMAKYLGENLSGRAWSILRQRPVVLCTRHRFHPMNTVAVRTEVTICPFLCTPFSGINDQFLSKLGVNTEANLDDRIGLLTRVAEYYGSEPLRPDDLEAVMRNARLIHEEISGENGFLPILYLPDTKNVMRHTDTLVFGSGDEDIDIGNNHFTHPQIFRDMARTFGIPIERDFLLKRFEVRATPREDVGEDFGQEVDLVSRIHRLLEEYHGPNDFIQEFVQNADDAKAKRISFIIDKRRHGTDRILSDEWATLQGPAVIVYNDSVFTEEDLSGIQRLGIGSKIGDREKIGRFGAGFNCAYRYADCPLFLSDNQDLCVLDPLRAYIVHSANQKSGKRFQVDQQFWQRYTDLQSCFRIPTWGDHSFPQKDSTFFRLPLREAGSDIWSETFDIAQLTDCMANAGMDALRMLLFLSSIQEISSFEITEDGQINRLWEVRRSRLREKLLPGFIANDQFNRDLKEASLTKTNELPATSIQPVRTSYELDLNMQWEARKQVLSETWIVALRLGFAFTEAEKRTLSTDFSRIQVLPVAGVARLLEWSSNNIKRFQAATRTPDLVFVSLPLPQNTGLPVTLHGHFCLDSEGRKNFFTAQPNEENERGLWNQFLTSHTLLPAYLDLIYVAKDSYVSSAPDYWKYFPDPEKATTQVWRTFAESLYQEICSKSLPFLPCLPRGHSMKFCAYRSERAETRGPFLPSERLSYEAETSLVSMGAKIVDIDSDTVWVGDNLARLGSLASISPAVIATFLACGETQSTCFPELPIPLGDSIFCRGVNGARNAEKDGLNIIIKLLEYLLEGANAEESKALIHGLPLLVTRDGVLQSYSANSSVLLVRNYVAGLFPASQQQFAHVAYYGTFFAACLFNNLTIDLIEQLLKDNLTAQLHGSDGEGWCSADILDHWWLKRFWQEIFTIVSEDDQQLVELTQTLSRWKLLPIKPNGGSVHLALLEDFKYILSPNVSRWITCPEQMPVLDLTYFSDSGFRSNREWERLEPFLASAPEEVLAAFCHWEAKGLLIWNSSRCRWGDVASNILSYFGIQMPEMEEEHVRKLRSLPLFQTVDGAIRALGDAEAFVMPLKSEVPSLEDQSTLKETVLLVENPSLTQLYSRLGIHDITEEVLYTKFLIPSLESMDLPSQLEALDYFHRNQDRVSKGTLRALRETKFIEVAGRKKAISDFYDHTQGMLGVSQSEQGFLPAEFRYRGEQHSASWIPFLRTLGLKTYLSKEEMVELAAKNSTEPSEESVTIAMAIVHSMDQIIKLQGTSSVENKVFLEKLARIPFIPSGEPESSLSDITEGAPSQLVALHNCVKYEHRYLVWSSGPFLPHWTNEYSALLNEVNKISSPAINTVLAHAEAVLLMLYDRKMLMSTEEAINSPESLRIQKAVMEQIYSYLQNNLEKHKDLILQFFGPEGEIPLVLVEDGKRLVRAQMVVERMPELGISGISEIPPFLYELPPGYKERYGVLFRTLGTAERPSKWHFVQVLTQMKQTFGEVLSPNSLRSVQLAQYGLVIAELKNMGSILFLLGTDGKLHRSTDLIHQDERRVSNRLKKAIRSRPAQLFWDFPETAEEAIQEFVNILPAHLCPTLLSRVIGDQVEETESVLCHQGDICPLRTSLRDLLHSKELMTCLQRLYCSEKGILGSLEEWKEARRFLKSVRVVCFEHLRTVLSYQHSKLPETGTEQEVFSFFDKRRVAFSFLHSADADPQSRLTCMLDLALSLTPNLPIRDCKKSGIIFPVLLSFDDPGELEGFLEKQGVSPLPEDIAQVSMRLGSPLSSKYLDLLIHSPHHFFSTGEIVGLCTDTFPLNNGFAGSDNVVIVLAQVITCRNKYDPPMQRRYEVLVSPSGKRIEAMGPDLYKFTEPVIEASGALVLRNPSEHDDLDPGKSQEENNFAKEVAKNCREVSAVIEQAYKLEEKARKKALRRLMLAWHPDKNQHRLELAEEVFKHIQQEIQKFEKKVNPDKPKFDQEQFREYWEQYKKQWEEFEQRTRSWSQDEEEAEAEDSESSSGGGNKDRAEPEKHSHNTELGLKYMAQAKRDLATAEEIYHSNICGHEHVVYMMEQAIEKALKGAILIRGGSVDKYHELLPLALTASRFEECPPNMEDLVAEFVQACWPNMTSMRYPDGKTGAIPGEIYTEEQRSKAMSLGQEICFRLDNAFSNLLFTSDDAK